MFLDNYNFSFIKKCSKGVNLSLRLLLQVSTPLWFRQMNNFPSVCYPKATGLMTELQGRCGEACLASPWTGAQPLLVPAPTAPEQPLAAHCTSCGALFREWCWHHKVCSWGLTLCYKALLFFDLINLCKHMFRS